MIKKLSLIAVTGLFTVAHSALLVEETFNYTAGDAAGVTATGTGLTGTWSWPVANTTADFQSGSLTAPTGYGFTPTAGRIGDNSTDFESNATVALTPANQTAMSFNQNATYYISFLTRTYHNAHTGYTLLLNDTGGTQIIRAGEDHGFGSLNGFVIDTATEPLATGSLMANGGDNLVVLKIEAQASGNDTISGSFWISGTDTLSAEPITWDITTSVVSSADVGSLSFLGSDGFGGLDASIDEVRIGSTFASVTAIPETSSLILMGVALGACLMIFRLRK